MEGTFPMSQLAVQMRDEQVRQGPLTCTLPSSTRGTMPLCPGKHLLDEVDEATRRCMAQNGGYM